jgi:nucleotide-binding universal stress UspA family protein
MMRTSTMSPTHAPFHCILVPVDGSSLAEQAIPYAIAIANRAGSRIRLALVHHDIPDVPAFASPQKYTEARAAMHINENAYLLSLTRRVSSHLDGGVSSVALKGLAATALAEYVRDSGTDLVVMTTHGRGGIQRAWIGSVADQLIRTLNVPVLVVPASQAAASAAADSLPGILVPLDGSALAESALEPAIRMARIWGAPVTLVRIVQPVLLATDPALPLPSAYDEELTVIEREVAETYLHRIVERLGKEGVQTSSVTLVGGATAASIIDRARAGHIGLIALATHGRGGISRLLLGSVADKLVRGAEVPVLVVPATELSEKMPELTEQSNRVTVEPQTHSRGVILV